MKILLSLFAVIFLFSFVPQSETQFLSIQNDQIKAQYQKQVVKSYPVGFIKHFEIVRTTGDITSTLKIPGITRNLEFNNQKFLRIPLDMSFGGRGSYWEGTFRDEEDSFGFRLLKLSPFPDVLSGRFWVDDKIFELTPVDDQFAALIEIGTISPSNCGFEENSKTTNQKSSSDCTPACSGGLERIRIVIDSDLRNIMNQSTSMWWAVAWQQAIFQGTIYQSLNNPSIASTTMDLNFANTPDIDDDLSTFKSWVNANIPTVDKAVLLTYYDYFGPGGSALYGSVLTIPGNVAIVEVRFGHPDWLIAHEVGHLYGGRHDDVSSVFCGRAYRSGGTATPIATTASPHIRVTYYSDPATYGATNRWNAGIIQNYWCGAL